MKHAIRFQTTSELILVALIYLSVFLGYLAMCRAVARLISEAVVQAASVAPSDIF